MSSPSRRSRPPTADGHPRPRARSRRTPPQLQRPRHRSKSARLRGHRGPRAQAGAGGCRPRPPDRRRPPQRGVCTEHATQERAPREQDGHELRGCPEHVRRRLRRGQNESRVREPALPWSTGRTSRGLGHRRGIGVEPEGKCRRVSGRRGEDRATVARADVDRHPLVAGDQLGDLTDVHLDEAPSGDEANHAWQDSRCPPVEDFRWWCTSAPKQSRRGPRIGSVRG
jgi:hypothetical protein